MKRSMQPAPAYASDFARQLRAAGGTIFFMDKAEYGFILRANIGGKIVRVVFPPISGNHLPIPTEPNSILHVARANSFEDFQQFLNQFSRS